MSDVKKKEEEPDLNIINQLRKACHAPSHFEVEFRSGKAKVNPQHAHGALVAHAMMKPANRGLFQKRLESSYAELQRTLKENVEETVKVFISEEKEAIPQ